MDLSFPIFIITYLYVKSQEMCEGYLINSNLKIGDKIKKLKIILFTVSIIIMVLGIMIGIGTSNEI